jgi:hypothetical protein
MQMAELLHSGQGGGDRAAANSLSALLKKSKKTAELPTADQVEFWRSPEKTGWMHSQGEHIKTWRKRWFVLKQGFLFRFASEDVTAATKPRGIVDLSQVTDVTDGTAATGRPNSIKLSTATGSRCYLTDSETSQVEWVSALESSIARIVKIVAGVDEEEHTPGNAVSKALAAQFKSYSGKASGSGHGGGHHGGGGNGSGRSSHQQQHGGATNGNGNQMLNVVNYYGGSGSGGGGGGGNDFSAAPSAPHHSQGPSGDYGYVHIDYGSINGTGFQVAPPEAGGSGGGGYSNGGGGGYSGGGGGGMYGNVYAPPANQPSYAPPQQQQQYGGGMEYSTGYGAGLPPQNRMQEHQEQQRYQQGVSMPPQQQQQPQYSHQAPAQDQYQYHQQQPQHQQQHGATLLDAVTAPAAPPQPPSQGASPWQVHYTADNRPYYFNVETQITQWEAPPGA